jgi:predicted nucleic acid-binding protein
MGNVTKLLTQLAGQHVYIDTNLFIYFLEKNQKYYEVATEILKAAENRQFIGYTGDATVAEVLVKPYQEENLLLVANFKAFFALDDFIAVKPHTTEAFNLCAKIRGKYGVKFADALHYATALQAGCKFLITNDKRFRAVAGGLEIIAIEDLI